MTVKEVKKKISDLQLIYDNTIKIQECCLRNEDAKDAVAKLESEANMSTTLRNFVSATACFISDEIHRLEDAIDNASVKI